MMRSLLIALTLAACMPPSTRGAALYDAARTYTEGVRWERFEAAAAVVPPAERAAFLDERDVLAKDLRITDSEITRVDQHGRTAEVSVKHAWYKDSEGTLRETVVRQAWVRQGLGQRIDLCSQQGTRTSNGSVLRDAVGGGLRAMRGAERVVDENVA